MTEKPLSGHTLVTLALNVPGPVAAARLTELGAKTIKVEPPAGDPLKASARPWYEAMTREQTVVTLDLKNEQQGSKMEDYLAEASLLLTSFRPSALKRLHLDWDSVHARHPRLCAINIIGHPPPDEEIPGHDLTYQAKLGLLHPPDLPITLHADLAGAERAVSVALALLLNFSRTGRAEFAYVSLYAAMRDMTGPLTAGLTAAGGVLGGGFPFYGLYQCNHGWIALAALEPGFVRRLTAELELASVTHTGLERIFRSRTAEEWEHWAKERDLPLVAVEEEP